MLKIPSTRALQLCGLIWLVVGFSLLRKGILFASDLASASAPVQATWLYYQLIALLGSSEKASLAITAVGFFIGVLKSRTVLFMTAKRNAARLLALDEVSLTELLDKRFLLLIGLMMGLGMSLNYFSMPIDWRSLIDIAVGSALIQGASYYFRFSTAFLARKDSVNS